LPFALLARLGAASSPPEERYLAYRGAAVERHSLSFLYEEHHVLRYHSGLFAQSASNRLFLVPTRPEGIDFAVNHLRSNTGGDAPRVSAARYALLAPCR
jgi:hypothetical protein